MITDSYDQDMGFLFVVFQGFITADEFISWMDSVTPQRLSVKNLKMFGNAFDARYVFTRSDLDKIRDSVEALCRRFTCVSTAILHDTPKETAISTIIFTEMNAPNYHHQIFFVKEHAIQWLLNEGLFSVPPRTGTST